MRPLLVLVAALAACARAPDPPAPASPDPGQEPAPPAALAVTSAVPPAAPPAPPPKPWYPWLPEGHAAAESLEERFAAPQGFARVALSPASFGAWLRALPLAPAGSAVRSFRGAVVLPADHDSLAAVVDLDVGDQDLQQCADSVIRLHAEWLFARGRRDASYRAASGAPMPFARWAHGERMVASKLTFTWSPAARADGSHASYRRWLDGVFTYANTGSLARDADKVPEADLSPGDFVVQAGAPGHAVLVLDVARAAGGRRALLLGQGFMPAQSFHVLRPAAGAGPWFIVEPGAGALETPFWTPFPWKALRRFAEG